MGRLGSANSTPQHAQQAESKEVQICSHIILPHVAKICQVHSNACPPTESVMLGPWPIESVLQLAKFSGYLPKRNAKTKLLYEPYEGLQNESRKSVLKYLFKYPAKKHLESHLPNPSSFGRAGLVCHVGQSATRFQRSTRPLPTSFFESQDHRVFHEVGYHRLEVTEV